MKLLQDLAEIRVLESVIDVTQSHLRNVGRYGLEGFVLWAGQHHEAHFDVIEAIVPHQTGHKLAGGVCVSVGEHELHRVNVYLNEKALQLVAQIHSHPTEAYHSDTDDQFAIATTTGSLSIVVPDFAARPFALGECAVYRLNPSAIWSELSLSETRKLIKVIADACQ